MGVRVACPQDSAPPKAIEDDGGCWQKKSKSVPRHRIWTVKNAIATNKPVSEILSLIDS
jgi:hypothetical protein